MTTFQLPVKQLLLNDVIALSAQAANRLIG